MTSKNLYIVGNGFDLHHGINSRYSDFKQYVECNDPELFRLMGEYLVIEENWSDLEEALASLDADWLIDEASNFLASYGADDWSDAYHHDYQFEIDKVVAGLSRSLKTQFTKWGLQLDIPSSAEMDSKRLNLDVNGKYLTFNYTPTLNSIYAIPDENILHIHNKAINEESNLILGHAWNPIDKRSLNDVQNIEEQDARVTQGNDIIDGYFAETYKPASKIIQEHIEYFKGLRATQQIFVMGHSLSAVDIEYFRAIIQHIDLDVARWKISYYGDTQLEEHRQTMQGLGVKEGLIEFDELLNF